MYEELNGNTGNNVFIQCSNGWTKGVIRLIMLPVWCVIILWMTNVVETTFIYNEIALIHITQHITVKVSNRPNSKHLPRIMRSHSESFDQQT